MFATTVPHAENIPYAVVAIFLERIAATPQDCSGTGCLARYIAGVIPLNVVLCGVFSTLGPRQAVKRVVFVKRVRFDDRVAEINGLLRVVTYARDVAGRIVGILKILQYGAAVFSCPQAQQAECLGIVFICRRRTIAEFDALALPFSLYLIARIAGVRSAGIRSGSGGEPVGGGVNGSYEVAVFVAPTTISSLASTPRAL